MTRRGERGSLAVEMAIIVPSLLLIFGLIFVYGRVATVNSNLEAATRDAARSATLARSYEEAADAVDRVYAEALTGDPACRSSLSWRGRPHSFKAVDFVAGEPITVDAQCTYSISDVGLAGVGGTLTSKSSFTSNLDPYRGIE